MSVEATLSPRFEMVTDNDALASLCSRWQHCDLLAVDTEFIRTQTFYPQLGLLQLSDGNDIWLIDPLAVTEWASFKALMTSPEVIKVFHSCSEDLLAFIAFFGLLPTPLFDTQIAATLLNMGLSISYQNLVHRYTGLELPKGETRSDWLQRPLSQSQLDYAALDVIYLPAIARQQQEVLAEEGKSAWAEEEFQRLLGNYDSEFSRDFGNSYLGMKGAWQYNGEQLLALKLLSTWREVRARDRDRPRNWILRDNALYDIARLLPTTRAELGQVNEVSPNFVRIEGDKVLALVEQARAAEASEYPSQMPRPLTNGQKKKLQRIRQSVQEVADALGVPVEYLGRRKTLVEYLQGDEANGLPEELRGWRGEHLLEHLRTALQEG